MTRNAIQTSEHISLGALLTAAGGFLEAYSFLTRDEVLANCQSGNLVLTALFAVQGESSLALRWFVPVCAFVAGVLLTEWCHSRGFSGRLHWRQAVVLFEALVLFGVGWIPRGGNIPATVLIAFVCAMQANTFRSLHGTAYATIMCTGNLRSAVQLGYAGMRGERECGAQAGRYAVIIACFAAGAAFGTVCTRLLGIRAVWAACGLLGAAFCLMFVRELPARDSAHA